METAIFYPGAKNDTVQRVMYIERPCVAGKWVYLTVKRTLDTCFALIGLIVFTLPMSAIALIIALDSPGDPIFKQERLGKDGKPFIMYKFRSMCEDAERDGPRWADADDARCTHFGAFLRRTRLDELPQIWNILKGDMSFVGPRPERACFYRKFEQYIIGSIERFIGILTEHYAGAFPLWLAPVQVKVMPITDRTNNYAKHVADRLEKAGLRVETDLRNEKIGYKIREAQSQKIPYMLVLGDKEAENDTISVRTLSGEQSVESLADFIARLQADVKSRKS